MLFSHPLMNEKGDYCIDAIQYEEEILNLKNKLTDINQEIIFDYNVLTYETLQDTLKERYQPTMLHLICHGDYDRKKEMFYLALEDSFGKLHRLYTETLD